MFTIVHAEMEGEPKRAKIVKLKQNFVRKKGEKWQVTNLEYLNHSTNKLETDVKRLYDMAADDHSMAASIKSAISELCCTVYLDSIAHSLAYIADHMDEKGEKLNEETDRD